MSPSTTIYTSTLCPVCGMVKSFLDSFEVTDVEVNVDMNPIAMIKLIGKTKKLSVPQTYMKRIAHTLFIISVVCFPINSFQKS